MWERGSIFLRKMGGVILVGTVVIWALSSFPLGPSYSRDYDKEKRIIREQYKTQITSLTKKGQVDKIWPLDEAMNRKLGEVKTLRKREFQEKSYLGQLGKAIAPVLRPLGFDWRSGVALLTGFVAKEIVVSTFGILYHVGQGESEEGEGLRAAIRPARDRFMEVDGFFSGL